LKPMYNQQGQFVFDTPNGLLMATAQETTPSKAQDHTNQRPSESAQGSEHNPQGQTNTNPEGSSNQKANATPQRKRVQFSDLDDRTNPAWPAGNPSPSITEDSGHQRSLRQGTSMFYGASSRDWINQHRWTRRSHTGIPSGRIRGSSLRTRIEVHHKGDSEQRNTSGEAQVNAGTKEMGKMQQRTEDNAQAFQKEQAQIRTSNREPNAPDALSQHNTAKVGANDMPEVTNSHYKPPPLPPKGSHPLPPPIPPPSPLVTRSVGASRQNSRPSQLRQNPPSIHKNFKRLFTKREEHQSN